MVIISNIKAAPLYQIVAKITATNDISVRVFSLSRAKMKDDTWVYPADNGSKHVPEKTLNIIDESELKDKSLLRAYCVSKNMVKVLVNDMEAQLGKNILITTPVEKAVKTVKVAVAVTKVIQTAKEDVEPGTERKFYGKDLEDYNAVKDILAGKTNAFAVIYKRYEPIINQKYKRNLRFDKDQADDLTMELFEKVYEKIADYKPTYTFNSWITKISNNFFVDYTRKKQIQTVSIDRGVTTEEGEQLTNSSGDNLNFTLKDNAAFTGEEIITNSERTTALNKAFIQLGQKDRDIIAGYYIHDKSYEEMAEEMKMPLGTVKAYMFRAKSRLRVILEGNKGLLACVQN